MAMTAGTQVKDLIDQAKKSLEWGGFTRERVEKVIKDELARKLDVVALHYLENCVGCVACAPACPYYAVSEEYGPVDKAELARRIYRKEATILGKLLGPLVNAKKPGSVKDLEEIVDAVYHCTNCGHCYVACPFGIDSGFLIKTILGGIATKAGYVPTIMSVFEAIELKGLYKDVPAFMHVWNEVLKKAEQAIGKPLPFDQEGAEYFLLVNVADAMFYPDAVIGAIRIFDKAGVKWTLPSKPLGFRPPIPSVIGLLEDTASLLKAIDSEVSRYKPANLVLLDGGFPYPWFRFMLPKILGRRPSYNVLHIVEVIAKFLKEGRIKVRQVSDKVTWHDPCQLARRGGVTEEPNFVLSAVSKEYRKLPHHGVHSYCCGGGGGIGCLNMEMIKMMGQALGLKPEDLIHSEKEAEFIKKIERDWAIAVKRKIDDVRESGADIVVTACPVCMHSIAGGAQLYGLKVQVRHVAGYVADHLE